MEKILWTAAECDGFKRAEFIGPENKVSIHKCPERMKFSPKYEIFVNGIWARSSHTLKKALKWKDSIINKESRAGILCLQPKK